MRFNYKKISAVLTSALLTGMTMGVAAAAAFPNDFTTQLPGIVYGASADPMDQTQATAISNYLANKVPSTGTDVTGGDSVKLEKSSTKFQLSYSVKDVIGTSITSSSPGNGMPTLLADGEYTDNDNDEFSYTQQIDLANWTLNMFDDNDYKTDTPALGVKVAGGSQVLNYTLEFTDKPYWSDLTTTDMPLLGKTYYVLSMTENTTLNLLDSAADTTLSEGETKTITVGGKSYEVGINFIGSSTVKMDVNGETTNTLSAAETQRLSDGAYIGIKSINTQDYAGGIKRVEFAIGKGKLKLVGGSDIQLNDNTVTGLKAIFTNDGDGTDDQIAKITLKWTTDGDSFIADGSSPVMPGFEGIKLSFAGMIYPAREKMIVTSSSSTAIRLDDFPLKDSTEDIDLVYVSNSSAIGCFNITDSGIGKAIDSQLATSAITTLKFNDTKHDTFIASWSDGQDAESYLMRFSGFTQDSGVEKANVQYRKDGTWTNAKEKAKAGDTVTIGNMEFTLTFVNSTHLTDKWANITAVGNTNFSTLYSKEGMKIYLPWCDSNVTAVSTGYANFGPWNRGGPGSNTTYMFTMQEEDKDENIGSGSTINMTMGFNAASTPEIHVSAIGYSHPTRINTDSGTSAEIGSTDVFLNYVYSPLATEVKWDKSGDQYKAELEYHGGESYGQIYLSDTSAAIGNVGNMVFKDSEQASWKEKNVIIVGGSCINTAAATALGVSQGTCASAWETATGIGAGKYLIQSVADKFTTGKIALVVAGYEKADTAAAVSKLINQGSTIDVAAGKKWVGIVGVEGLSTITPIA